MICAVLAAAVLGPAGAGAATARCKVPKKADVVANNRSAVAYTLPNSAGADTLYGCLKSNGVKVKVAKGYDDGIETSTTFDQLRLNGRFLVWQWTDFDVSCKADCPPGYEAYHYSLERIDLKTRKHLTAAGHAEDGALVVSANRGAIGWIEKTATGYDVNAGAETLDSGAIDPQSLRLKGSTLSWTNAGMSKTATLR
jgi:hypothetical protein